MTLSDYVTMLHLTDAYGLGHRPTAEAVLARLHEFDDADLAEVSRILDRLPDRALRASARHPAFPAAVERLIQTSDEPRPRAVAFLKLGVPVRRLVLPLAMRAVLSPQVAVQGGRLYVDSVLVDLQGITTEQHLALRNAGRQIAAAQGVGVSR